MAVVAVLAVAGTLSACVDSVQGKQLDTNYATTQGTGSMTAPAVKLPHGRYTFFSYADPPMCVTRVALLDIHGSAVVDDSRDRVAAFNAPPAPGGPGSPSSVTLQSIPTAVQQEIQSGTYRLKVSATGPSCAWRVEQILNYTLSNEAPLKAAALPVAPSLYIKLSNISAALNFQIATAGIYHVQWSVTPCDTYSADLLRTGGGTEHLSDGAGASAAPGVILAPDSVEFPVFLGVGAWSATVKARCFWQIVVSPWLGSRGGGTEGFSWSA